MPTFSRQLFCQRGEALICKNLPYVSAARRGQTKLINLELGKGRSGSS